MTTLAEYEESEAEAELIRRNSRPRDSLGRFRKVCWSCESGYPDGPSGLCLGCQAYREHLRS